MAKKPPPRGASNSAVATLPAAASSPNLDKFPGPHDALEQLFSNPPSLSPWQTPSSSRAPRTSTTTTPIPRKAANDIAAMADPFEVRMRFTNQLRQLNASVTSAQKAAQYALKNRDMAEDLHSCILEQLERNNMNTRANILYFLEPFLTLCSTSSCPDYIRMMQRDIIRVVDAVAPDDGSGAANVKVARQVLRALAAKSFLEPTTLSQIEEVLRDREGGAEDLDRKQVEQRIEEDRERHKRQRENHWAVPAGGYVELERLWEETSELGEDDGRMLEEEWGEWKGQMKAGGGCGHGKEVNGRH